MKYRILNSFPGIESITEDDWAGYCQHIRKLENEYWIRDGLMENFVDNLIIQVNEIDSEDDEMEFSE